MHYKLVTEHFDQVVKISVKPFTKCAIRTQTKKLHCQYTRNELLPQLQW